MEFVECPLCGELSLDPQTGICWPADTEGTEVDEEERTKGQ